MNELHNTCKFPTSLHFSSVVVVATHLAAAAAVTTTKALATLQMLWFQ